MVASEKGPEIRSVAGFDVVELGTGGESALPQTPRPPARNRIRERDCRLSGSFASPRAAAPAFGRLRAERGRIRLSISPGRPAFGP